MPTLISLKQSVLKRPIVKEKKKRGRKKKEAKEEVENV